MSQEMPFRYFDRDVKCIFKFFRKRFKLTFELQSEEVDGKDLDLGENNSRPSFASISQVSDSLDKELAASGFSKKDQENLEKFIEGSSMDSDSCEEANTDDDSITSEASINHHQTLEQPNDGDLEKFDSLSLPKQKDGRNIFGEASKSHHAVQTLDKTISNLEMELAAAKATQESMMDPLCQNLLLAEENI